MVGLTGFEPATPCPWPVALAVLPPVVHVGPDQRKRFLRDARAQLWVAGFCRLSIQYFGNKSGTHLVDPTVSRSGTVTFALSDIIFTRLPHLQPA